MIDEIFRELSEVRESPRNRAELIEYNKKTAQALTAIYEIGLECIGADEDPKMEYKRRRVGINRRYLDPTQTVHNPRITVRNELKASQRKAWAKACGVTEK